MSVSSGYRLTTPSMSESSSNESRHDEPGSAAVAAFAVPTLERLARHLDITDTDEMRRNRVAVWLLRSRSEALPGQVPPSPHWEPAKQAASEPVAVDRDFVSSIAPVSSSTTHSEPFTVLTVDDLRRFMRTAQPSLEQSREGLIVFARTGQVGLLETILIKASNSALLTPQLRGEILVATLNGPNDDDSINRILNLILPHKNYKEDQQGFEWWIHSSGVYAAFKTMAERGMVNQMRFMMQKFEIHPEVMGEALHLAITNLHHQAIKMLLKTSDKIARGHLVQAEGRIRELQRSTQHKKCVIC